MFKITKFHQLSAWQEARQLVLMVYQISDKFPKDERFGITSQIRRATTSITANIAEGFERHHTYDKIKFYEYARASTAEVQNFLMLSKDLGFIEQNNYKNLLDKTTKVMQLLQGLIVSIKKRVQN